MLLFVHLEENVMISLLLAFIVIFHSQHQFKMCTCALEVYRQLKSRGCIKKRKQKNNRHLMQVPRRKQCIKVKKKWHRRPLFQSVNFSSASRVRRLLSRYIIRMKIRFNKFNLMGWVVLFKHFMNWCLCLHLIQSIVDVEQYLQCSNFFFISYNVIGNFGDSHYSFMYGFHAKLLRPVSVMCILIFCRSVEYIFCSNF